MHRWFGVVSCFMANASLCVFGQGSAFVSGSGQWEHNAKAKRLCFDFTMALSPQHVLPEKCYYLAGLTE